VKSWLFLALIFATSCGGAQSTETRTIRHEELNVDGNLRLSDLVLPTHYELDLSIDPTKETFTGQVRIDVTLGAKTRVINLHSHKQTIKTFAVESGKDSVGGEVVVGLNGGIALVLSKDVPAGPALIAIQYEGTIDEAPTGLYRVKDGDAWYAFTQFEPLEARQAFPSFDEPRFKTTFDTTLRVPKGLIAAANSGLDAKREEGGEDVYVFKKTKPLATYVVAFAVGDFDVVEAPAGALPFPLRLIATKGKGELGAYMLARTPAIVTALTEYFGGEFPYDKLDIVAVPNFSAGAMENVGLVTFRESLLLIDPETASVGQRRGAMSVMIHELAHMWFGNLVTMVWWDDLWLNESFATWMAAKQLARMAPQLESQIDGISGKSWVIQADSLSSARIIRNPIATGGDIYNAFDGITYGKGARVLGMFEQWLGEEAMQKGIQAYLKNHAYGSATTADFLGELEKSSGKPVTAAMATFLDQPGTPMLDIQMVCEADRVVLNVEQSRFKPAGSTAPDAGPWQVPACFRFEEKGKSTVFCELVDAQKKEVVLPTKRCPKWIYPNADENGYYLWTLPGADLQKLTTTYRGSLSVQEKVGLLNNLRALLKSEKVAPDVFISAIQELGKESHRTIFEGVLDELDSLDQVVPADKRTKWTKTTSSIITPRLRKVGFEPKAGEKPEVSLIRTEIIKQSVRLADDENTRKQSRKVTDAFLKDMSKVSTDVAAIALRISAEDGDSGLWLSYKMALAQAPNPAARNALISGLGAFKDPDLLKGSLALMFDGTMHSQDFWSLIGPTFRDPKTFDITWAWFTTNYEKLVAVVGDKAKMYLPSVGSGFCTEEGKQKVVTFFADPAHQADGLDRRLANNLEYIDQCIRYRAYVAPGLDALLK
jgi:alanyl aminopeptidase